ncbi:MAG: hypothetical protein J6A01_00100 [Proteobacteria bacterium]|nr:hypothetical protein [Pseudomonadota bacterium]
MKRSLFFVLLSGLVISGCGDDNNKEPSTPTPQKECESGTTGCEGSTLLTCGMDGQYVKTPCNEGQLCAKDGDIHRCMSQAEYDALNNPVTAHDCETDQSKCVDNVRYTCDADFHWLQAENCADSGKSCKQDGNTASCIKNACESGAKQCNGEILEVCEEVDGALQFISKPCEVAGYICVTDNGEAKCAPKAQDPKCTDNEIDCDENGNKLTCTSGKWTTSKCPNNQKCVKHGNPEIAECVDAQCAENPDSCGEPPEQKTGNASVNISIKNNSSTSITIAPRFRFVLSTEGTSSEYSYNRTEPAVFDKGDSITIDSGAVKSYKNVEIPGDSKQYIGQHFARETELNGYANNVLLYDTKGVSETFVPEMIDPATIFKDGATYEIVYSYDNPQPPSSNEDIIINLTLKNESASAVVLNGEVVFVLANPDKDGNYHGWEGVYNRTQHFNFSQSQVTLNAGKSQTFNNVQTPGLGGRNPLPPDLLSVAGRKSNVLLYDIKGVSETYVTENLDPNIIFVNNGSYTIIIP